MKQKSYMLNTILVILLGVVLLAAVFVRAFAPMIIIPKLDVLNLSAVSLVTLVLEYYLAGSAKRCYPCVAAFAAATFGILPYMAGFVNVSEALRLALMGAAVFTVLTALYSSMINRLSTGPAAKAAPVLSAFGLYLAVQCFGGMF